MAEAGAVKGRELRWEVRQIQYGASRDRPGDVVWLDFAAPHKHFVVDVLVTSTGMNFNIPSVGAPLPLLEALR
jgi:hypothetical protein